MCVSMSKNLIQSSKWRAELGVWEVALFPVLEEIVCYFSVCFGIAQIWSMYHNLDKRVWFTIIFFISPKEPHSVPDMKFLYLHLFCLIWSYRE